jgi:2-dehydro-3-deoxyphosphogluconate aldolase / (4S)-4-hydroxy-2-oxoglutarate aldolase
MTPWISLLQQYRIFAVIRATDVKTAYKMAIAAASGGIRLLEITWNTANVESLIPQLQAELPDCYIGTGTILDMEMASKAIAVGCKFMFAPHVDRDLIKYANDAQIPIIAGAMTPTEILQAWQWGADAVKIFPIKILGGWEYIKCLKPVFTDIPLIPTGGVSLENAISFLNAGAIAVGISTDLFLPQALTNQDWRTITDRARAIVEQVEKFNKSQKLF